MEHASAYYPAGRKFRVIQEGCELSGWRPMGIASAFRGWRQQLHVGDVIETLGFSRGMGSDPGYGVHFKAEEGVIYAEFHPSTGGMWAYQPAPGYLEPVDQIE